MAGGLFALAQSRTRAPLIRPAMFRSARLTAGLATSALVSTVLMTTLVVGPFYLTGALSLDAAAVGLVLSIGPIVVAFTGVPAGRIADRFGAPRTIVVGLAAIATGCVALATLPVSLGIAGYVAPMVVITAGYALFQTANNTNVMADVEADQRGVTSGMLNLSRNLGLITGASVMGAVFSLAAGSSDIKTALPDSVAFGMHVTFLVAAALILVALAIAVDRPTRPRDEREDRGGTRPDSRSARVSRGTPGREATSALPWQPTKPRRSAVSVGAPGRNRTFNLGEKVWAKGVLFGSLEPISMVHSVQYGWLVLLSSGHSSGHGHAHTAEPLPRQPRRRA